MPWKFQKPELFCSFLLIRSGQTRISRENISTRRAFVLGESIRRNGILQPLSVRAEDGDGKYELIAGERRLRAAAESGFDRVPCIVINADSTQAAVYSVIENLQRRDLNFFEEALAIESLGEKYGLDRAQLSERLGKAPSTLSNKLRLLRLPEDIREKMISADLTERHARALLRIENPDKLHAATDTVIKRSLNVAQTEKLVNAILDDETAHKPRVIKLFKDVRIFVNTINHAVDTMREAASGRSPCAPRRRTASSSRCAYRKSSPAATQADP